MNDNEKYIEEFVNDIPFDAPNEKPNIGSNRQFTLPRYGEPL